MPRRARSLAHHQQAHRKVKVGVQRADLIVPEVMNDEVRDPAGPAGSGKSGKPTDMDACEVRLDGAFLSSGRVSNAPWYRYRIS